MGPYPKALMVVLLSIPAAQGQQPGWSYSPLGGEGDRATLGCARDSTPEAFTCLAVRCEDDFSVGVHVHSSRIGGDVGAWEMTVDREARSLSAAPSDTPYGGRFVEDEAWLLDRLRHGTFVYLRHAEDADAPFQFIDLDGSYRAIAEALYWCAPRVAAPEQIGAPGVETDQDMETEHEPPPAGTQ